VAARRETRKEKREKESKEYRSMTHGVTFFRHRRIFLAVHMGCQKGAALSYTPWARGTASRRWEGFLPYCPKLSHSAYKTVDKAKEIWYNEQKEETEWLSFRVLPPDFDGVTSSSAGCGGALKMGKEHMKENRESNGYGETGTQGGNAGERLDSDETVTMIRQAKAGSQEAYAALRRQYTPLIQAAVARYDGYDLTRQEKTDLREEADRIFLCALSSYDVGQEEVSFGLYARVCLHNGLVSEMRHLNYLRRLSSLPVQGEDSSRPEDPSDRVVEEERFSQLSGLVRSCLTELENRIWWAYVAGMPVSDIAASLGRSERAVYNAVYRIRKKLRTRLSGGESRSGGHE
jgi:RNA polymerase sporulation-specific sigma factor